MDHLERQKETDLDTIGQSLTPWFFVVHFYRQFARRFFGDIDAKFRVAMVEVLFRNIQAVIVLDRWAARVARSLNDDDGVPAFIGPVSLLRLERESAVLADLPACDVVWFCFAAKFNGSELSRRFVFRENDFSRNDMKLRASTAASDEGEQKDHGD